MWSGNQPLSENVYAAEQCHADDGQSTRRSMALSDREDQMKRRTAIPGIIAAGLLMGSPAFAQYNPGERAITGGLMGAGTGAIIGAIAGGGHGAAIGAAVGGGLGALGGAATTPPPPPRTAYRHHYYHHPQHRYYSNY
jgi:hypothetical protein